MVICFLCGLACLLSTPPFFLFPVLSFSISLLLSLISRQNSIVCLFLILISFIFGYVLGNNFDTLIPVLESSNFSYSSNIISDYAICIICMFLSLFPFVIIIHYIKNTLQRYFFFGIGWIVFEFIANQLIPGRAARNSIGMVMAFTNTNLQIIRLLSIYFIDVITIYLSISPYLFSNKIRKGKYITFFIISLLIINYIYGYIHIKINGGNFIENKTIVAIQGNVHGKFFDKSYNEYLYNYYKSITNTIKPGGNNVIIVWPKNIISGNVEVETENFISKIYKMITRNCVYLIFGNDDYRDNVNSITISNINEIKKKFYTKKINKRLHCNSIDESVFYHNEKYIKDYSININCNNKNLDKAIVKYLSKPLEACEISILAIDGGSFFYNNNLIEKISKEKVVDLLINLYDQGYNNINASRNLVFNQMIAIKNNVPTLCISNNGISALFDSVGSIVKKIDFKDDGIILSNIPL